MVDRYVKTALSAVVEHLINGPPVVYRLHDPACIVRVEPLFVSIVLIIVVETRTGVAFGLGVLVSYAIHVAWKMARFDPEWMTEEVTENVEDTLTQEIDEVLRTVLNR